MALLVVRHEQAKFRRQTSRLYGRTPRPCWAMAFRLAQTSTLVSARVDQAAAQPIKRRWRRVVFGVLFSLVVFVVLLWWYFGLTIEYVYY